MAMVPALESYPQLHRKRVSLPLRPLVEETSKRPDVPNHLLESKIYHKLKGNSQIQAEPPELHFTGFELGKDYQKVLKLINISSEVINIHIIPTQTKYFQTKYSKKYRLVPGLAYTVRVQFCPDEWRYFYDCVRVHCQGEENLVVPVHAYPIIDNLHMPSRVDLPPTALGQSVSHSIPLSCSCPVDFEFEVFVIQPHPAFCVQPLTGVIPANDEVEITVTFSPSQFETCHITIQLVISQFNSQPHVCTITGSSAPHLALSQLDRERGRGDVVASTEYRGTSPAHPVPPQRKTIRRSLKKADKSKAVRGQRDTAVVQPSLRPSVDFSTPAGVAKMLLKRTDKLSSKDLREAMSCGNMAALQNRQVKEAFFMSKVRRDIQEERANHLRWQVHLGQDAMSEEARNWILLERERTHYEYMEKKGIVNQEEFASGLAKLSTRRLLREAGQLSEGTPSFQLYSIGQLELRHRALRKLQQAARKVVIRCRMNRRLACLKQLAGSMKKPSTTKRVKEEQMCPLKISPDKVIPFSFPIFSDQDDELIPDTLGPVPVEPIDVTVKTHVPFFKLQVPQHYKLMGYQPVSTWEAYDTYIPTTLARPLRTGALDELFPEVTRAPSPGSVELKPEEGKARKETKRLLKEEREQEEEEEENTAVSLTFTCPEALIKPTPANSLRIFNPAPGIQAYKPTPRYLESDLEYHLCPLPRYIVPESNIHGIQTPNTQKKFLDRKEVIKGVMTWKNFDSATLNILSNTSTLTSGWVPRRSVDYNEDVLPISAPPLLTGPPDDMVELMGDPSTTSEEAAIHLTPEMIGAEFLTGDDLASSKPAQTAEANVSDSRKGQSKEATAEDSSATNTCRVSQMRPHSTGTITREQRQQQLEEFFSSQTNTMGKKVMVKLQHLRTTCKTPTEDHT